MPIPGTNPAVAVNDVTGEEFCAVWEDPGWKLYRRFPGETDMTFASSIGTGPEKQAGLVCYPTKGGELVFAYDDGTTVAHLQSTDQGDTWEPQT